MLVRKFRQAFFPTAQMQELERWNANGGDETFRFNYENIGPDSTIIDVGGYHGQWTSDMVARYGCQSIVLEPVPQFAEFIRQRFRHNPRVQVREFALGARSRAMKLCCESIYSTEYGGKAVIDAEMIDVAEFFKDRIPRRIAAMSLNCEGGEYELLSRMMDTGIIERVKELEIQFHDFVPAAQEMRRSLRRELMATHREVYSYPFVWEHWTRR
jgi:FkbM family methyltransferase